MCKQYLSHFSHFMTFDKKTGTFLCMLANSCQYFIDLHIHTSATFTFCYSVQWRLTEKVCEPKHKHLLGLSGSFFNRQKGPSEPSIISSIVYFYFWRYNVLLAIAYLLHYCHHIHFQTMAWAEQGILLHH